MWRSLADAPSNASWKKDSRACSVAELAGGAHDEAEVDMLGMLEQHSAVRKYFWNDSAQSSAVMMRMGDG